MNRESELIRLSREARDQARNALLQRRRTCQHTTSIAWNKETLCLDCGRYWGWWQEQCPVAAPVDPETFRGAFNESVALDEEFNL